jgi:hypothetical protein
MVKTTWRWGTSSRSSSLSYSPQLLQPLGMAGGTEAAGAAGEHQEVFRMAVGTADAGKPATRIAAVEITLDHFLDDRPEEAVLVFKTFLIPGQETVEIMK